MAAVQNLCSRAILFVSHSMAAVQNLCSRAILLHAGEAVFEGPPEEAASRYYALAASRPADRGGDAAAVIARCRRRRWTPCWERTCWDTRDHATVRGGWNLVAARFDNKLGVNCLQIELLDEGTFTLLVQAHAEIAHPHLGINLYDRMNNLVFAAGNAQLQVPLPALRTGDRLLFRFSLRFSVQPGPCTCTLMASEQGADGPDSGMFYDVHEGVGPIEVFRPDPEITMPFYGIAQLPMSILPWSYLPVEPNP